jgi:hypothetical protein
VHGGVRRIAAGYKGLGVQVGWLGRLDDGRVQAWSGAGVLVMVRAVNPAGATLAGRRPDPISIGAGIEPPPIP